MMLANLAFVHRSVNFKGTPFFPVPTSKRIMSDPVEHLAIFAQLLLSNDSVVVETAADLLRALVEFNLAVNTKLYLTGAFYFACRYTGNNFVPLARLFEVTHVQQSFHDSASSLSEDLPLNARSFLGNILPAAVVNILLNYGAERFANVFTGEFDLPEVIWNAQLRMHLVEMIDQHIGDFPARLRQVTTPVLSHRDVHPSILLLTPLPPHLSRRPVGSSRWLATIFVRSPPFTTPRSTGRSTCTSTTCGTSATRHASRTGRWASRCCSCARRCSGGGKR